MVTRIFNSDLTKALREGAKIQTATDTTPHLLGSTVIPTMEVNPRLVKTCNIHRSVLRNSTGAGIIYTVPTDRDFFLNSVYGTVSSTVLCDNTVASITVTMEDGTVTNIFSLYKQTLTAESQSMSISFPIPLKLKRGTNILIESSFTVGAMNFYSGISGFTNENITA